LLIAKFSKSFFHGPLAILAILCRFLFALVKKDFGWMNGAGHFSLWFCIRRFGIFFKFRQVRLPGWIVEPRREPSKIKQSP
jgi:hypothetical protein